MSERQDDNNHLHRAQSQCVLWSPQEQPRPFAEEVADALLRRVEAAPIDDYG